MQISVNFKKKRFTTQNDFHNIFEEHGNQMLKFNFLPYLTFHDRFQLRLTSKLLSAKVPAPDFVYVSGDPCSINVTIKGVSNIYPNYAYGRLDKNTGYVDTLGNPFYGGDSSSVQTELQYGVTKIVASREAFMALKQNGRAIIWGDLDCHRGIETILPHLLEDVIDISSGRNGFAALKSNGYCVIWGTYVAPIPFQTDVKKIVHTDDSFAFLKNNGSVFTCGNPLLGGDSSSVSEDLQSGVIDIVSTSGAFLALKSSGQAISWGSEFCGGNFSSSVSEHLQSGVTAIFTGKYFFAVLKSNQKAIFYDNEDSGPYKIETLVRKIEKIDEVDFCVLKTDGSTKEVKWPWSRI